MIKFMAANVFKYTKAIVSGIPNSLAATAVRMDGSDEPVNLEKARQQHKNYVQVGRIARLSYHIVIPSCFWLNYSVYVHGNWENSVVQVNFVVNSFICSAVEYLKCKCLCLRRQSSVSNPLFCSSSWCSHTVWSNLYSTMAPQIRLAQ